MASLARFFRPLATARRLPSTARAISCSSIMRDNTPQPGRELEVGELEGAKFKIEPLRRTGEDDATKRARLVYQSRKRGTLESDLLLSTFAAANLPTLPSHLLDQYDLLLDENDWDIYYWATQLEPENSSQAHTNPSIARSPASATDPSNKEDKVTRDPPSGEWAQTVGNFRPAYRPVPQRWKDSEILALLREHVKQRSVDGEEGKGMGFMPALDAQALRKESSR